MKLFLARKFYWVGECTLLVLAWVAYRFSFWRGGFSNWYVHTRTLSWIALAVRFA
jgi:hypothetical protein